MEWFSQNWVWVLFIGAMIAMHMFGHGGHGSHGGHGGGSDSGDSDLKPTGKNDEQHPSKKEQGHCH